MQFRFSLAISMAFHQKLDHKLKHIQGFGVAVGRGELVSCRVDEANSNEQVVSGHLIYETGRKSLVITRPTFNRVDLYTTRVTR